MVEKVSADAIHRKNKQVEETVIIVIAPTGMIGAADIIGGTARNNLRERAIAIVVIEKVFSRSRWAAGRVHSIVGNKHIQVPIIVVVSPSSNAGCDTFSRFARENAVSNLGESPVSVVPKKEILGIRMARFIALGNEKVQVAVIIEIRPGWNCGFIQAG